MRKFIHTIGSLSVWLAAAGFVVAITVGGIAWIVPAWFAGCAAFCFYVSKDVP